MLFVGGGGPNQSFLAFNKSSGDLAWKSGDDQITHATPRLADINGQTQLIYFMQSGLVGVAADSGKQTLEKQVSIQCLDGCLSDHF